MSAKELKGVYNLNPTSMVMKQGSEQERRELTREPGRQKARTITRGNETPASEDLNDGVESRELAGHAAMPTRMGHHKHSTGERRVHEDHHHAVKHLKGKM